MSKPPKHPGAGHYSARWQRRAALEPALVEQLINRDERAFGLLYERYVQQVRWHILPIVGLEMVDDTVQNAFIRAWRYIHKYDPTRAGLSTWLVMMGRQQALEDLRRPKSRSLPVGALRIDEEGAHHDFDRQYFTEQVNADYLSIAPALVKLSVEHRQLIELIYLSGYTVRETADKLGLTVAAAYNRLNSALKQMRALLTDSYELTQI